MTPRATLHPAALPACALALALSPWLPTAAWAQHPPPTAAQQQTAQAVAERGVPISELSPTAPDTYTVKRGDTLWGISGMFLRSPWRWPELWGMNLQQIRNPHLIYPGQLLVLTKQGGRAWLSVGQAVGGGDGKLSPRIRVHELGDAPIASVPMEVIRQFLTQAVVFDTDALARAPRIVAANDDRVLMSKGDVVYVRGDLAPASQWQLFREPVPLINPDNGETLGYEAVYVGAAERLTLQSTLVPSAASAASDASPAAEMIVPASVRLGEMREEATQGDRLAPAELSDTQSFVPHAPAAGFKARVVSIYGGPRIAGKYQIIAINKGTQDGVARGHTLALWRDGRVIADRTSDDAAAIAIPPEKNGTAFVFRAFSRVAYALVLRVEHPVVAGDQLTAP